MFGLATNRLERAVLDLLTGPDKFRTSRSNVWPGPEEVRKRRSKLVAWPRRL